MVVVMKTRVLAFAILLLAAHRLLAADVPADTRSYELRVYHVNDGKLETLHTLLRDHAVKLFEKHGITSIGYWTPIENTDRKLYYLLSYPSREAREKAWASFRADPDWKSAIKASEKNGKVVAQVESTFLHTSDFSPAIQPNEAADPRVFELRTYTATPGNLAKLQSRFRSHTVSLFERHGMTNFGYWLHDDDQPAAADTLVYLLAHKSKAACEASFKAFREDPQWVEVRKESEKEAGGPLTVSGGVKSVLLAPTDYSPTK
jgi:hypothetical protein